MRNITKLVVALLMLEASATVGVPVASVAAAEGSAEKAKIAFAGDSIVDNYWSGVTKRLSTNPCLKSDLELGRFAKNGTGLARGDFFYWPREIRRIVQVFNPNVVVLSVGLNDQQFIVDGSGHRTAWGAPDWAAKYRAEIDIFLKNAASGNAAVLIVGLPVMRPTAENTDIEQKNAMFAAAVEALANANVEYVPPWKLDPSAEIDRYASYGRDKNGRLVQIRTPDGEHFTPAGEDLVAEYLFPKIIAAAAGKKSGLERCLAPQASAH